jgi:hypothetical protein
MAVDRSIRPSESALPQLSLRLAKLLRLSGEGKRDGELGVFVMVAEVGTSSMADEEELCVWFVSTDMTVTATVAKEGSGEQRGLAARNDVSSDQATATHRSGPLHPAIFTFIPNAIE